MNKIPQTGQITSRRTYWSEV